MNLPYLSQTPGIGGKLKESAEDFAVEEITAGGEVLVLGKKIRKRGKKGEFTHFVLEKRDWNTVQALKEVAGRLGVGDRRFGYAGTKDRVAATTQLCSAWGVPPARLLGLRLKDISISSAWPSDKPVKMGELLGNRFTITVRGIGKGTKARVGKVAKELKGLIPNYFGAQRFGSTRSNTHLVGKMIVAGDVKTAVLSYICATDEREMKEAREARERFAAEGGFHAALHYFPGHLKYERTLLAHLAENKNDYVGALRRLPRGLSLMFVHAYQSHIFNGMLARRVLERRVAPEKGELACPAGACGFPVLEKAAPLRTKSGKGKFPVGRIIGYETESLTYEENAALAAEGISQKGFFIKSFPEISAGGALRPLFVPLRDFRFRAVKGNGKFSFSLPAGAYATVAMREFMDRKVIK